jgi:hypothetical protein
VATRPPFGSPVRFPAGQGGDVLAIAIAASFRLFGKTVQLDLIEEMHLFFVLMVFVFPMVAAMYGAVALFTYNAICSWLGWRQLSLPWGRKN